MVATSTLKQLREAGASNIGLLVSAIADTVVSTSIVVTKMARAVPHPELLRDAYITKDGIDYRRVTVAGTDGVSLTIDSELPTLTSGDAIGVYLLLNPEEMNDTINEEIVSNSREYRETIPIVNGTNEYTLPDWIHHKGQVMDVFFRTTLDGAPIREMAAPSYRLLPSDDSLVLHLIHMPFFDEAVSIIVRGRKYYEQLGTDDTTTTLPRDLAVRMVQVALYKRLRRTYGDDFIRRIWGEEISQANAEYVALRQEYEPPLEATELTQDFEWDGPDIPIEMLLPKW